MFEPIKYCNCGNTEEYGIWQFQTTKVKEAIKKLASEGSIKITAVCPICLCINVINKAELALKSI